MRNYWQLQAPDGGALHKCHSKAAVQCNRPHGWKGVALCCRRSPRSELELCYAQNGLKILASPKHFILVRSGCQTGAREVQELKRYARGRQKYREESCERTIASRVE